MERKIFADLSDAIRHNLDNLRTILGTVSPGADYDALLREVDTEIQDGRITNARMADEGFSHLQYPEENGGRIPFVHSCIYSLLAQRAQDSGDTERGWAFVAHAMYLTGFVEAAVLAELSKFGDEDRRELARKGGRGRAERFQRAKDEAARLLREKRPQGGWKNKTAAVEEILGALQSFVRNDRIALTPSNLPATLKRWMRDDPDVRAAFQNATTEDDPTP